MNLQRILAPHLPVRLWSTTPVHVAWSDCGITLIDSAAGNFPRDGTLVLIGQFVALGDWFGQARFHDWSSVTISISRRCCCSDWWKWSRTTVG